MSYFPREIVDRFEPLIMTHPLRRQLVSTIVANEMLNSQGVTFVSRLEAETGAAAAEIVRAYRAARGVVGASARWRDVEMLAGSVDTEVLRRLLAGVDGLVETITRWFIGRRRAEPILERIEAYRSGFVEIADEIRTMGPKQWQNRLERKVKRFVELGVPEAVAVDHVYQVELVHAPDIIDVAVETGLPLHDVGRAFYRVGQALHIDWLEMQIENLPTSTRWQRWAMLSLEQELMTLRRAIVERVFAEGHGGDADAAFASFSDAAAVEIGRLSQLVSLLRKDGVTDSAAVVVALRQMMTLAGSR